MTVAALGAIPFSKAGRMTVKTAQEALTSRRFVLHCRWMRPRAQARAKLGYRLMAIMPWAGFYAVQTIQNRSA